MLVPILILLIIIILNVAFLLIIIGNIFIIFLENNNVKNNNINADDYYKKREKITFGGKEHFFERITTAEHMRIFFENYRSNFSTKELVLDLLEPEIDKDQFQNYFKDHPILLDLILMIRLGLGNFINVACMFDIPELNMENIDQIINDPLMENIDQIIDEKAICVFNDNFLNKIRIPIKEEEKNTDFKKKNEELFQKLNSLVGDRENGYQFNKKIYDDFLKEGITNFYFPVYYNENYNGNKNDLFLGSTTIFYLLNEIDLMLKSYRYSEDVQIFNKKQKTSSRIIIKKLIETLSFFNQICKNFENQEKKEEKKEEEKSEEEESEEEESEEEDDF